MTNNVITLFIISDDTEEQSETEQCDSSDSECYSNASGSPQSSPRTASADSIQSGRRSPSQPKRRRRGPRKLVDLLPTEFEFVRGIKWMRAIRLNKNYLKCLKEFPSVATASFARDELVQFASTLAEVEPIFSTIISNIKKSKDAADIAM